MTQQTFIPVQNPDIRARFTCARAPVTMAVVAVTALLAACSPETDSGVASDQADRTMRSTAGEAVERARQNGATSTDAAASAAASGSTAAAQSAEEALRKTAEQVKAADEKLEKARQEAKQKIPGSTVN